MRPVLDAFAIETQLCHEIVSAVDAVNHRRLDAVIVDLKGDYNPTRVLRATRSSPWNRQSTVLAIVNQSTMQNALRSGANFLIHEGSDRQDVTRCLRAAYGTMLQQRRRVERCPVDIPVIAKFSSLGKVEARISDISVGGLALQCQRPIEVEQQVSLSFVLPLSSIQIHVAGRVVNSDHKSRAGVFFSFVPHNELKLLDSWITVQLDKMQDAEIPTCAPEDTTH